MRLSASVDAQRGLHERYVFTYRDMKGHRSPIGHVRNSGWKAARERAANRYRSVFGKEAPMGFRKIRFHDLRHAFGRRLRAAGVSYEDRQDLLGHKAGRVTTHYSAPEIGNLIDAANRIQKSRRSPAPAVLRVVVKNASVTF